MNPSLVRNGIGGAFRIPEGGLQSPPVLPIKISMADDNSTRAQDFQDKGLPMQRVGNTIVGEYNATKEELAKAARAAGAELEKSYTLNLQAKDTRTDIERIIDRSREIGMEEESRVTLNDMIHDKATAKQIYEVFPKLRE